METYLIIIETLLLIGFIFNLFAFALGVSTHNGIWAIIILITLSLMW